MIFCLLMLYVGPVWELEDTKIYAPINPTTLNQEVAVGPDGHVYVLDVNNATLTHYNRNGSSLGIMAPSGKGPGELDNPIQVNLRGDYVYVLEMGKETLHMYHRTGKFIKDLRFPGRPFGFATIDVKDGWIIADWEFSRNAKTISLNKYNSTLTNLKQLDAWPRIKSDEANVVPVTKERTALYNPAKQRHFLARSLDGKTLYVSIPGPKLKILVYDLTSQNAKKMITHDAWKQLPFNETWGNEYLQAYKDITVNRPGNGPQILKKISPDFPDYFPIVRNMYVAADDSLVVTRWSGSPDTQKEQLFFNKEGKIIESKLTQPERVLAIVNQRAYVTTFNEENEEAGIAVCPLTSVNQFLAENPIPYEIRLSTGVVVPR